MTRKDKKKIRQFNKEIAAMKKENYETFYNHDLDNDHKKKNILSTNINLGIIIFILGFCMLTTGSLMLFDSLKLREIYIGGTIMPNWMLAIPLLVGIFFTYFFKDKTIPLVISVFGGIIFLIIILLSENITFTYRPTWQYALIIALILIGIVLCIIMITHKHNKKNNMAS